MTIRENNLMIQEASEYEKEEIQSLILRSYGQYKTSFVPEQWQSYEQELINAVYNPNIAKLYVAILNGVIVGTVQLFMNSSVAYQDDEVLIEAPIIRYLAVEPSVRGQGIARKLLETLIAYAKKEKISALYLHTTEMMKQGIQLYEYLGFTRCRTYDYLKNDRLIICYQYDLKGEK